MIEDLRTLPGRTGLAALCIGLMVQAALFASVSQPAAQAALLLGFIGLSGIALFVLPKRLSGSDTAGPNTPAMHLVFVGFILVPGAALPLGLATGALPWLIWYCTAAALLITALTIGPLLTGEGPPPLRPLQTIQLAPPAFIVTGALMTGATTLGALALVWATLVALGLVLRAKWMTEGGFSGFWSAFTFPVAGFAGALLLSHQAFGWEILRIAAGVLLVAATLYIPVIAFKVLKLWATGMLAAKTNASIA